jgi:hypothetical protein
VENGAQRPVSSKEATVEKYRFMSAEWIDMARREITQLLADKDLAGI